MPKTRAAILKDFVELARWEHHFSDHGPQVPLYAQVAKDLKMDLEEKLWFALLGMGYYHEGSGWAAWCVAGVPERSVLPPTNLKIGSLRRNLFGGRIRKHFESLYRIPRFTGWLRPVREWQALINRVRTVWGNGKWAGYTTAEALVGIAGLPVTPDGSGFLYNSGPKKGLHSLGLSVDEAGVAELCKILTDEGVTIEIQALETVMCNWNNLIKGEFYIGRSLDRQQTRILEVQATGVDCGPLWKARREVFEPESLGEISGWPGLDMKRLKHYKKTGKLLMPWENR